MGKVIFWFSGVFRVLISLPVDQVVAPIWGLFMSHNFVDFIQWLLCFFVDMDWFCSGVVWCWFQQRNVEYWMYPHSFGEFQSECDWPQLVLNLEGSQFGMVEFVAGSLRFDVFSE